MSMKALIVDDDRVLADVVAFALRREGYEVIQAHDGLSALQSWTKNRPDLIILDINLPKMDGFSVCQRIRKEASTPIIMLTVRSEDEDVVRGLVLGADDYIPKPFSPRQLIARAQAVLRHCREAQPSTLTQLGDLHLDASRRVMRINQGEPIHLTVLEGRLLDYLMVNAGQGLSYEVIIDHVWGPRGGDRNMLRQLVHRLRSKTETDPAQPVYIKTIPGLGYGMAGGCERE